MHEVVPPRVLLRFRPRFGKENSARCVDVLSSESVQFLGSDSSNTVFSYDAVYSDRAPQDKVYEACVPVVESFLESFNGTIMAYGQTGSGKTHSLFGTLEQPGLVPLVIATLLQRLEHMRDDVPECTYTLSLNIVEIYCERIRDLLDMSKDNLSVSSEKDKGIYLQDATEYIVTNAEQALRKVHSALNRRAVSATNMNERSSRSHCLVYLMLTKKWADGKTQHSKLCLVDLAGSERQDKTGAEGVTLDEAKLINKSLSCLGNVVKALTEGNQHVPYRESKLTRVLQDALGGNAKVVILICCSPVMDNAAETLSSLRFGIRAKGIQNISQVSSVRGGGSNNINTLLATSRQEVERLRGENDSLSAQVQQLQQQLQQLQVATQEAVADAVCRTLPAGPCNAAASVGNPGLQATSNGVGCEVGRGRWNTAVLLVTGLLQLLLLQGYFYVEDHIRLKVQA